MKCATCGYDLRGSNPEGDCPECSTPVRTSAAIHRVNWTPALGLRRAAVLLAIQIPTWTAGIVGANVALRPALGWFARAGVAGVGLLLVIVLAFIAGSFLTRVVWIRLQEQIGFSGYIVATVAVLAGGAVAAASGVISTALGVTSFQTGPVALTVAGTVLVRVVHDVAVDG